MITARADVVGSLLRPAWLVEARRKLEAGELPREELRSLEDRAVDEAIRLQEAAGLDAVSDGEMRRLSFQGRFVEGVEGFGEFDLDAFLWGDWRGDPGAGDLRVERPASLGVVDRLALRRHLTAEDFDYLRARTIRLPKTSLPSPGLLANFWSPQRSAAAYPTLDAFLQDVVAVLREEVAALVRRGATYIQLDAPHYLLLLDAGTRAFYESRGWPLKRWLDRGVELDNAAMEGFPTVTFGLHLCRGNQGSRWLVEGGYDRIAAPIFRGTRAQRLLLEFDDARSGSFAPLGGVPEDKLVVLGLVTTKFPRRETVEEVAARVREAARHLPAGRLAVSPQCGFASSVLGNRISPEDQAHKLRVVAETAREVWGDG